MRARHRHFNPRDAGALVALDSRYGFSLSGGSSVSSWLDRTNNANNADQATAANQPKYETNELNGQPVIRFDGTNDDLRTGILSSSITVNSVTGLSIHKKNSGGTSANNFSRIISLSLNDNQDFSNTNSFITHHSVPSPYNNSIGWFRNSLQVTQIAAAFNTFYLNSFTLDATNIKSRINGGADATGTTSANALNSNRLTLAAPRFQTPPGDSRLNGDIAMITLIGLVSSTALRRRLEHAAAYSFKLACS